jgi:hypothetical protein
MIWDLVWGPVARRDLVALPMRTAERLDAAVIRFAETGRGPVTRPYPHDPRRLRLVVSDAAALLHADERTGVLYVGRVFRRT